MASTPVGGVRVDLSLNSAAFMRDLAKTNAAISKNTTAMQASLTRLRTTANSVGAAFGAWLTFRVARRVISFLDQSVELAAKLDNELGKSARAFEEQGAAMRNAFQLGAAQGFIDVLAKGAMASREQMVRIAQAGLIVGKVFGAAAVVVVDVFTVVVPKAINASLRSINLVIGGLNTIIEKGEALDNALGLNKDYGRIPLIDVPNIEEGAAAFFDLADAEKLVAEAAMLAAGGQKAAGNSIKSTTGNIIDQLNAMDELRQKSFQASIETAQQWLGVADTVGQALGTLFKENKAVQIAQTIINTASAIMNAMATLPFPINWAQSAAAAALGAAQIATIASTNPGSSKSIKKSTGGSSGKSAPAKAGSASSSSGGTSSRGQAVNITLVGEGGFNREQVRALIGQINQAVGDGATLRVSG